MQEPTTMNEYHMRFLVDDRQRELRAEADRSRLARHAKRSASSVRTPRAPRQRRPRLVDLLSRVIALGS
jgi:hypothetical protein